MSSGLRRGPVLAIILTSYLMIVLDISIVITALPKIYRDLGFSAKGLSWVQTAYTLAFGGLLLLGARAGDILGRRRMGQGGSLGPLTAAGISGVAPEDAGAASGVVNVAHQLGGSRGHGVLVTVFAASGSLAHGVAASLTVGTAMLAAALVLVVTMIVRQSPAAAPATA